MVELSESDRVELLAMLNSTTVSARVATRARIVLWRAEGWLKKDVALRAGVSRPTVDAVLERFAADGVAGLPAGQAGEGCPARPCGRPGAGANSRGDTVQPAAGDGVVALVQP